MSKTHGEGGNRNGIDSRTPEYHTWYGIIQRCLNENSVSYAHYGGRGITVCDRWRNSYDAFLVDMGRKPTSAHSIDRIDNSKGYYPENCRWATRSEQERNKDRRTLTMNGETHFIAEWAEILGISHSVIKARIYQLGYSDERALTQPVRSNSRGK